MPTVAGRESYEPCEAPIGAERRAKRYDWFVRFLDVGVEEGHGVEVLFDVTIVLICR